jgi:hypothetical protein
LPYPSEKTQRSKDADAHNPSETDFSNPSEILVHRGGGFIKWNGPTADGTSVNFTMFSELGCKFTTSYENTITKFIKFQLKYYLFVQTLSVG